MCLYECMYTGAFGKVFKGVIYLPDNTDPVAIKTIKSESIHSQLQLNMMVIMHVCKCHTCSF